MAWLRSPGSDSTAGRMPGIERLPRWGIPTTLLTKAQNRFCFIARIVRRLSSMATASPSTTPVTPCPVCDWNPSTALSVRSQGHVMISKRTAVANVYTAWAPCPQRRTDRKRRDRDLKDDRHEHRAEPVGKRLDRRTRAGMPPASRLRRLRSGFRPRQETGAAPSRTAPVRVVLLCLSRRYTLSVVMATSQVSIFGFPTISGSSVFSTLG